MTPHKLPFFQNCIPGFLELESVFGEKGDKERISAQVKPCEKGKGKDNMEKARGKKKQFDFTLEGKRWSLNIPYPRLRWRINPCFCIIFYARNCDQKGLFDIYSVSPINSCLQQFASYNIVKADMKSPIFFCTVPSPRVREIAKKAVFCLCFHTVGVMVPRMG